MRFGYHEISKAKNNLSNEIELNEVIVRPADSPFDKLADELIAAILQYLDVFSLCDFAQTNKRANNIFHSKKLFLFCVPIIPDPKSVDVYAPLQFEMVEPVEAKKFQLGYINEVNPYGDYDVGDKIKWSLYKNIGSKRLGGQQGIGQVIMGFTGIALIGIGLLIYFISGSVQAISNNKDKNALTESEAREVRIEALLASSCLFLGALTLVICNLSRCAYSKNAAHKKLIQDRLAYAEKVRGATDPRIELPQLTYR